GEYVSPGEFRALIRTISRTPAERHTSYKIRKLYAQPEGHERLPIARMPIFSSAEEHAPITSATGYLTLATTARTPPAPRALPALRPNLLLPQRAARLRENLLPAPRPRAQRSR